VNAIAKHAALAAKLLATHPDLPAPTAVDLHNEITSFWWAVSMQMRHLVDVVQWAKAHHAGVQAVAYDDHVMVQTVFTVDGIEVKAWDHAPADSPALTGIELPLREPVEVDPQIFFPAATA